VRRGLGLQASARRSRDLIVPCVDTAPEPASASDPPSGFRLWPDVLAPGEEAALRADLLRLPLGEVRMHGVVARRRVAHLGRGYAYGARAITEAAAPLPPFLAPLRARVAALAGVFPEELVEALVTWYPPGAGIGWHRDAPAFGLVVGVSLGAPARLRLRDGGPGGALRDLVLPPGSAYLLDGPARWRWYHQLPPVKAERLSVTFRTLRSAPPRAARPRRASS
jgi:DNA oxidative demethylase